VAGDQAAVVRATEKWFIRRGVPLFVEDYRAATDVWTRALPFLVLWWLSSLVTAPFTAVDMRGVVGFFVALALIVAGFVAWNRFRGRPSLALPNRVNVSVLLVWFVAVPAILAAGSALNWVDAVLAMAIQLSILGLTYLVTRYALISLSAWAIRRLVRQLGDVYRLATRALPLLLLVTTFLFINTEVWQVAGALPAVLLWATVGFFIVLAVAFLAGQLPAELARIDAGTSPQAVVEACARTPLEPVVEQLPGLDEPKDLEDTQRRNLLLVMLVAQGVQVLLISLAVYAFFLAFGVVAITTGVQAAWMGVPVDALDPFLSFGPDHALTRPLVRVATFLAGFSALYVTVSAVNDSNYRSHFFEQVAGEIERLVRVRRAYLVLREEGTERTDAVRADS